MRKLILACLAIGLFPAAGCARQTVTAFKPVDRKESPDILVKNAVECRSVLTSLAGNGVMRIVDSPNNFGLSVNMDIIADRERMRIRADKLAGAIQAFDVAMLGDDVGFYVPSQKTFYIGTLDDLDDFAFHFRPDDVVRHLLMPDASLLLKHWNFAPALPDDPRGGVMLEEAAPPGAGRLRLALDADNGMLMRVTRLDRQGNPVQVMTYGDYRGLYRGRRAPDGAASTVFPHLMAFSWPSDRRLMEMRFKSIEGDAVVLDDDFELAGAEDAVQRPLREARLEPDDPESLAASPARRQGRGAL